MNLNAINPQPEPGEDITTSYQWRFRDPIFVAAWDRWSKARDAWRRARERTPFNEGGPNMLYNPDPSKITNTDDAALAQEFLDARVAYTADLDKRTNP